MSDVTRRALAALDAYEKPRVVVRKEGEAITADLIAGMEATVALSDAVNAVARAAVRMTRGWVPSWWGEYVRGGVKCRHCGRIGARDDKLMHHMDCTAQALDSAIAALAEQAPEGGGS